MSNDPEVYQVIRIDEHLVEIDGKDLEEIWSKAPWTNSFIDIEGGNKPTPEYDTRVKMLYDTKYLYIFAKLEEPHIWADISTRDAIIYHNNDFEVFLKPEIDGEHYFEIEINSLNTIFDLMMPKPYRFGGRAQIHWDAKNFESSVHVEGTINNSSDVDEYWSIEMKIPFESVLGFGLNKTPDPGNYWQIDFSRVQWHHTVDAGKYSKRLDSVGDPLPEQNWVWSPIGVVNMHYPERWGYIQFVDSLREKSLPKWHSIRQLAWNVHYALDVFKKKHHKYPESLESLSVYRDLKPSELNRYRIVFSPDSDRLFYTVRIADERNNIVIIDSLGNISYDE